MEKQDYEIEWPNLPIKYLIVSNSGKYIVFIDNENDLDWATTDEYDNAVTKELKTKFNEVKNEADKLESIPLEHLDKKIALNYKRQIGEALVRAFDFDYENAFKMLKNAEEFICKRNIEESRVMFLISSGWTTGVSLIVIILLWIFRDIMSQFIGTTAYYLSLSFFFGAIGAFLSVILRLGNLKPDYNATKRLHYFEGVYKIIAGMISALIIALCIKSEIILPIFSKIQSTHLAMILGGLIAGASERFVPSIISKLDNSNNTK